MDDLRLVATRIWDLLGHRPASARELAEALFARLRWFPPSEAEQLVRSLQQAGLFLPGAKEGSWGGAPGLETVVVPITYRPPSNLASLPVTALASLADRVLAEAAAASHESLWALRQETDRLVRELLLLPGPAALLVAWRRGCSFPALREEAERELRGEPLRR